MALRFEEAAEQGVALAQRIIQESSQQAGVLAARPFEGYLILEGDSWFDYPFFKDLAESLKKDYGYKVESAARHGDTAEGMAYIPKQIEEVHDIFKEMADDGHKARAILVSGGGNDFVDVFGAILNHRHAGVPPLSTNALAAVLKEQIPRALVHLVSSLVTFSEQYFGERRPVLIHGYGNPVPDGRDYPILGLSGPWLRPVFARKGYVSGEPQPLGELQANTDVLQELIRIFNEETLPLVAAEVTARFGNVLTPVDLRPAFSNQLASAQYRDSWRDEMHATADAYERAAGLLHAAIQQIPIP